MFFSDDEDTVRQSHEMYLQEIVPQYYRLCSVGGISVASAKTYTIHCPPVREGHDADFFARGRTPVWRCIAAETAKNKKERKKQ